MLVVKQARDEERASVEMRTGIGDNIANICRESALLIAADLVRLDSHLVANIKSNTGQGLFLNFRNGELKDLMTIGCRVISANFSYAQ